MLYQTAIKEWGECAQILVAIEEMAELTKALAKNFRSDDAETVENVVEEIADVEIMMDQLRVIYKQRAAETVDEIKKAKLNRLAKRLGLI